MNSALRSQILKLTAQLFVLSFSQLLDDGTGRDPLEVHNFGKAGKYLFRPCQNEDGTLDEECAIDFTTKLSKEEEETIESIKQGTSLQKPFSHYTGNKIVNMNIATNKVEKRTSD